MLEVQSAHNFFELNTLEDIFRPVRNAPRVKYTCFDVSRNLLILGATSGSLYVFRRKDLAFLRVIPNKEGSVVAIRIDGNESHVAFSTNRGTVIVLKHNVEESYGVVGGMRMPNHLPMASGSSISSQNPHYVQLSRDHRGSNVTTFQWSTSGGCLFIGDNRGTVTAINIAPKKTQTLFLDPSWTVVKLASKIVQLDFLEDKLLISTLTSCYICNTSKEQYTQIGSKPRDGEFGACFSRPATSTKQKAPVIYAARPGSRLWEADIEGNVIYTHQLKNAFVRPMEPLVSIKQEFQPTSQSAGSPQSLNFAKLLSIGENHLLTWAGSHLYIIDTSSMSLTLSTKLPEHILDVRLANLDEVYVQHPNNHIRWLKLLPVDRGLHYLLRDRRWELCGLACIFFDSVVKSSQSRALLPRSALQELEGHLRLQGFQDLADQLGHLMLKLEEPVEGTMPDILHKHYRLESGIYVVNMPNRKPSGDWRRLAKRDTRSRSPYDVSRMENADTSLENAVPSITEKFKQTAIEDTPMYAAYLSGATWDVDNSFGYLALPSIKANVSLGEIKSSLSSTYKSGKQRIMNTMEMLEDHLKSRGTDGTAELLDVQCDQSNISSMISFDIDTVQERQMHDDPVIFPTKEFNRQNYKEKLPGRQFPARNIQLDLQPLFEATSEAWDTLQNLQISDDISRQKAVLEQWLDVLHSTQESWYTTITCLAPYDPKPKVHQSKSHNSFFTAGTSENMADSVEQSTELETVVGEDQQDELKKLKSSQQLKIETDDDMKSREDCLNVKRDLDQHTVSLEDVLWWQDVISPTKQGTKQMPLQSMLTECWRCNPRLIPGNAWALASSQKESIMQLATMCVKTKIFGRMTRYSESFANWTRIDSLDEDSNDTSIEPHVRQCPLAIVPRADVTMDHARSLFVKQYFGLLRPDAVFQEVRLDMHWSCSTWQYVLSEVIVTISGMSSSNLARGLHYNIKSMNPFLSILRSDLQDSLMIANKLIEAKEKVSPRDVLYLDQTLDCQNGIFLTYMDRVFWKKFKDTEESGHPHSLNCEDHLVEAAWVQLMLQDNPTNKSNSKCTTCLGPRLFSHVLPWKWQDQLVRKFRSPCLHVSLFLKLCEEHGFWLGKIYLLQNLGLREEMYKLIVQLGDVSLLQDTDNLELLPQNRQEWNILFELVISDLEGTSLHCKDCVRTTPRSTEAWHMIRTQQQTNVTSLGLPVEDVALLMLQHCAADFVVSLVSEFISSHPNVQFSMTFYQTLVLAAALKEEQTILTCDIKKKANACIWSKRANYASSEVKELLLQKETSKESASPTKGITEKLQCHWGIHVDLASCCNVCSLPLGLLSANDGVRVYPCGHGYHRRCAITNICSTCTQSSN